MSSIPGAVAAALSAAERILILSHVRPDGDAIGSQVALALALRAQGKLVKTWNEDGCPQNLRFLEGTDSIEIPPTSPETFDLVVCLDTASKERLGTSLKAARSEGLWLNLDHHASNPAYGDVNWIDVAAAATGEIVHRLLVGEGWPFPKGSAEALYVALSTDTGSFRYPNTTARTLETVADLLHRGIDAPALCLRLYESYPRRRAVLLGELLRGAVFRDGVAALVLDLATKARLGIQPEDVEGLIDAVRCLDEVTVAGFFEELDGERVRVSLRSKNAAVDVNAICSEFGGGGHRLAAGARIRGTLGPVVESVLKRISREISHCP